MSNLSLDYSTIDLVRLRKLPLYRPRPGHDVSDHMGSGCFLDAPGYPSYFIQSVYNSRGDELRNGPYDVIADPERDGEYRVIDGLRDKDGNRCLGSLYIPVPMNSDRFVAWADACYRHLKNCYEDPEEKDNILIWPVPYYRLNNIALNYSLSDEERSKQKFSWGYYIDCIKIEWSFSLLPRYYTNAEDKWIQYIETKRDVAVPVNHRAVRAIREIYPEYQPILEKIVDPPVEVGPDWWERSNQEG